MRLRRGDSGPGQVRAGIRGQFRQEDDLGVRAAGSSNFTRVAASTVAARAVSGQGRSSMQPPSVRCRPGRAGTRSASPGLASRARRYARTSIHWPLLLEHWDAGLARCELCTALVYS